MIEGRINDNDDNYGRILCVDDDPKICEMIVTYLEDSGFTVYEANDGIEALDIFRKKKPDLVLSDLNMPKMGGLELLEVIKMESPETPFIIVSGADTMSEVINCLRLGAWDFVPKPILNVAVLEHVVCKGLERGRLVIENKNYRAELEHKNIKLRASLSQLEEDQNAGKSVQQKLLPKTQIQYQGYSISHIMLPSLYLSGDFVDYFEINKDKIGFYIADVSGHGASSAFVTVLLKSLMQQMLTKYKMIQDDAILRPERTLKIISDNILEAKLGKYLTIVYCVLDLSTNHLTYSVGGHNPSPILWDGKKAIFLPGSGFAVGIYNKAEFNSVHCDLPEKFSLAMFSDGIFEIMDGKTLEENEKLILQMVNKTQTIEGIMEKLGVQKEGGFPDDITLLLMNKG